MPKGPMSAETRARLSANAKARWAQIREDRRVRAMRAERAANNGQSEAQEHRRYRRTKTIQVEVNGKGIEVLVGTTRFVVSAVA